MIHHVGVVTLDEKPLISIMTLLQGEVSHFLAEAHIDEWGCLCRVYQMGRGETLFEAVIPTREGRLMNWYREHSPASLHHIAIRVPSCEEATRMLLAGGLHLISQKPVEGVLGWRVNFIHPSEYGVMVELVEVPR